MDELGIYDDLDEFHEQEEKKSKELVALEAKYEEALRTVEAMKMEKKDLRKKIRIMEHNLQSLLDTAKAEVRRKDKLIQDLRKEKDDLCFRRDRVQQKPNRLSWRTDPRHESNAKETFLAKDCHVKANWANPFKPQPSNTFKEELTAIEAKSHFEHPRCIEDVANKTDNDNTKVLPYNVKRKTKTAIDDDVVSTNELECNFPSHSSEKALSKNMPNVEKQPNRIDSTEMYDFKDRDRYNQKYDKESEADKDQINHRSKHRNTYKDKSRERSPSARNVEKVRSNSRRTDKDKSDRHRYDDHSSCRNLKSEHRDQSRSSDRYDKSNGSRYYKEDSKKNSERSRKERSPSKKEKHQNSDRYYKSHQKDDEASRRPRDKSKKRKRRRSSHSDEEQHEKSRLSHRDRNDEKSSDAKRFLTKKDLFLEEIEVNYDTWNTEINSLSNPSKVSISKNIDSDKSGEKDKNLFQIENGVEEGKSVEAYIKGNNKDQLEKDKCILESEIQEKTTETNLEVKDKLQGEIDITADNLELKCDKLEISQQSEAIQAQPKRLDQNEMEKESQSQSNILADNFVFESTEHDKFKISQQKEENITSDKIKLKSLDENVLKTLQRSENDNVAINSFTPENQTIAETKESKKLDEKDDDIYHQQQAVACLDFEDIKTVANKTRNSKAKLSRRHETTEENTNLSNIEAKQFKLHPETTDDFHEEVASITKNTFETLGNTSVKNSSESTKETEENSTKGSLSESVSNGVSSKTLNTPEKLALFDTLFGTTASSVNASTGTLDANVKDTLCYSNNSSRSTSPSLYTDLSQTPSKNSPRTINTSPNKKAETITICAKKTNSATESRKQFVPSENEEILKHCLDNSKTQTHELNVHKEESHLVGEKYTVLQDSLKFECDMPGLKAAGKLNVDVHRIESEDTGNKNSILNRIVDISSMDFKCTVNGNSKTNNSINEISKKELQESENASESIGNRSFSEIENIPNITSDIELDKDKLLEKSSEHDLQTVCLVDISDDEVTNMNIVVPTKLNRDKSLNLCKTPNHQNKSIKVFKHTDPNVIDGEVLKKINEQCSRLELASKDQSNKTLQPTEYDESTMNVVEAELQQIHESPKTSVANVQESNVGTEIISFPGTDSNCIEAQTSKFNDKIPIVIELDNEDESTFYSLTLSSDEDDETLANLQNKYKLQQKEKIEILENIQLPTLFQSASKTKGKISPKKLIEVSNVVDLKPKEGDTNARDRKYGKSFEKVPDLVLKVNKDKQLCQKKSRQIKSKIKVPLDNECIPIIDITEDNFKKSPKKRMEISNVVDLKSNATGINAQDGNDRKSSDKKADLVLIINGEKQLHQNKTEQTKSKITENESVMIIDITEDSLLGEIKSTDKSQREIVKETEDPSSELDNKTEILKIQKNKIYTGELDRNVANKIATKEDCPTENQVISCLSVDYESIAEPSKNIVENSKNFTELLPKQLNPVISKLKTPKQKLSTQKSTNFIKLNVEKCKERRRLTEHNGKILQDDDKHKQQQDALHEMLSENMQDTIATSSKTKTVNQLSSKSSIKDSPTGGKFLTKDLQMRTQRMLKKSPINAKASISLVKSTKNCCGNFLKTPVKRKRSTSPVPSQNINNSINDTNTLKAKSQKLSSSAEVRAMLVDGKSPQMTNDCIIKSPLSMKDVNLDELDKNMEAIFQSPAKLELTLPLTAPVPCGSSTVLDITINETINLESSTASENLNKTNDSSFESKHLSLGTTQYVYERVSEDVVNLFITRRRSKKRATK